MPKTDDVNTTQSWIFRRHPGLRFSVAGTVVSLIFGLVMGLIVASASWEQIRPFIAIAVGVYGSIWFSKTLCKDYEKDD